MASNNWTKNYMEVIYFMEILWSADVLTTTETDITPLSTYLRAPQNYSNEHQLWAEMDMPEPSDDNWDDFVNQVNSPDIVAAFDGGQDEGSDDDEED